MLASPRPRCHTDWGRRRRVSGQTLGLIPHLHGSNVFQVDDTPNEDKQRRESTQIPMANILQELKSPEEQIQSIEQRKDLHDAILCALDGRKTPRKQKYIRKKNVDADSLRDSLNAQVLQNERQKLQMLMTRNKALFSELVANKQTRKQTQNLTDHPIKRRKYLQKDMIQRYVDLERSKTFAKYSTTKLDTVSPGKLKQDSTGKKDPGNKTKECTQGVKRQENINNPEANTPAPARKEYLVIPTQSTLPSRKDVKPARRRQMEMGQPRTNTRLTHKSTPILNSKGNIEVREDLDCDKPHVKKKTPERPMIRNTNYSNISHADSSKTGEKQRQISSTAIVHEFVKHAMSVAQDRHRPPVSAASGQTLSDLGSRPGTQRGQLSTPTPWTQDTPETLLKPDIPGGKVRNIPGLTDRPFKQTSEDTLWMISPTPEYVLKSLIGIWLRPFISEDTSTNNYIENLEKHEKYAEAQRSKLLWIRAYMRRLAAMV